MCRFLFVSTMCCLCFSQIRQFSSRVGFVLPSHLPQGAGGLPPASSDADSDKDRDSPRTSRRHTHTSRFKIRLGPHLLLKVLSTQQQACLPHIFILPSRNQHTPCTLVRLTGSWQPSTPSLSLDQHPQIPSPVARVASPLPLLLV